MSGASPDASGFAPLLANLGVLRSNVAPVMRQWTELCLAPRGVPPEAHLHLVKATRGAIRPLLDAFRNLVEPVASADATLAALETELERSL